MEYVTHNDKQIDFWGTHLQGYIEADYSQLVKLFGECLDMDSYKIDWEWVLEFENGVIATIYNWKNGPNYCGEAGLHHDQIHNWHVGGNGPEALRQVQTLIGWTQCQT